MCYIEIFDGRSSCFAIFVPSQSIEVGLLGSLDVDVSMLETERKRTVAIAVVITISSKRKKLKAGYGSVGNTSGHEQGESLCPRWTLVNEPEIVCFPSAKRPNLMQRLMWT